MKMTETIQIMVPKWNIESETGYKPRTTFWQDFSIADAFGEDAEDGENHQVHVSSAPPMSAFPSFPSLFSEYVPGGMAPEDVPMKSFNDLGM